MASGNGKKMENTGNIRVPRPNPENKVSAEPIREAMKMIKKEETINEIPHQFNIFWLNYCIFSSLVLIP